MADSNRPTVVGKAFKIPFSVDNLTAPVDPAKTIGIDNPVASFIRDIADWGRISFIVYRDILDYPNSPGLWLAHDRSDTYVGEFLYKRGQGLKPLSPFMLGVDIMLKPQRALEAQNLRLLIKTCGQMYSGTCVIPPDIDEKIMVRHWVYTLTSECVALCWDDAQPELMISVQYLLVDVRRPVDLSIAFS